MDGIKMFKEMKKNFGFGCMRLPMSGGKVDYDEMCKMTDEFLASGFNYFDTAKGYLNGMSETAIRECVVKRHSREEFILTDKLSINYFKKAEDIPVVFEKQLKACGVEYFDFYLMHAQCADYFEYYKKCRAYEQALELKKQGKIKHFGISFHDTPEVLEKILTEYPQIEVVQIQLNYVDFDDTAVQSGNCYEVCRKFGKPVIVMEPVKGGNLANLPKTAEKYLDELGGGSAASYAIRYAASFENVVMVLSGMSDLKQMKDNISAMTDFKPLNEVERQAIENVKKVFSSMNMIPCTACRYCVDGCPKKISIPDLFACMNSKKIYKDWNSDYYYGEIFTKNGGKASECIACGKCEKSCPQHLPIRNLLKEVAKQFEKN